MTIKRYDTYEDFEYNDLLTYAGIDCLATSRLLAKLGPQIFEKPSYTEVKAGASSKVTLMSISESMERYLMPAFEFICDMEINGIKYDVALNQQVGNRMQQEIATLEDDIFASIGRELDLNSGKVMAEFLYGEKGYEPPGYTKTGEPSTDGDAMAELAKKYEGDSGWLKAIGKRNDIASVYRTFVRDYVAEHVKRDGRVHPSYNLNGTSSFRITGDKPNLKV